MRSNACGSPCHHVLASVRARRCVRKLVFGAVSRISGYPAPPPPASSSLASWRAHPPHPAPIGAQLLAAPIRPVGCRSARSRDEAESPRQAHQPIQCAMATHGMPWIACRSGSAGKFIEQTRAFLPRHIHMREMWCQGGVALRKPCPRPDQLGLVARHPTARLFGKHQCNPCSARQPCAPALTMRFHAFLQSGLTEPKNRHGAVHCLALQEQTKVICAR